jgi:hypothetical protein
MNILRRGFLTAGGLGLLALPQILQAQERNNTQHKAVINIFLGGGPPHQDMWDIKDKAPTEIRGEFKPISTNVAGIQIGECFPMIASMFDKFTAIRSVVGCKNRHDGYQCTTGWLREDKVAGSTYPAIGSAASKVLGPVTIAVPPNITLLEETSHSPWYDFEKPGYLGTAYQSFTPNGQMMKNLKLNISKDRFKKRQNLLRRVDISNIDMKLLTEESFDVLMSSKLLDALDLSKEDPKTLERYGTGKPYKYQYDGAATDNEKLLIARRLVQAGARSITLNYGRWDSHGDNFGLVRDHGPKLDQCVSALVGDLDERGMLDNVTVVVWGEFGRTPKINKDAGRDHWSAVSCALLAGGGMQHGQIIGSTNRYGEEAADRPVHIQEVCATMYKAIGIDPTVETIIDNTGRPQYLLEHRNPIEELV